MTIRHQVIHYLLHLMTADLDNATFNAKIKSSSTFEFWTSEGIYQTSAGNDDIIASNIKAGVTLFGTTGTYTDLLFPPVSFSSTATTTTQIDHSWSSVSAATSYLLIVNEDSPVTFIPASADAGTYNEGDTFSGGEIVYIGSGLSDSHTVNSNSKYHYALYSYDGSDYSIVANTSVVSTLDCSSMADGEWVKVPGDQSYGTSDFCVMKYEAKNVSSAPESNASERYLLEFL